MTKLINGFLEYFKHESTWRGIIALATALGAHLDPAQQQAIVTAGLAIWGAFEVFVVDRDVVK